MENNTFDNMAYKIFKDSGLILEQQTTFEQYNLLIGKNGAGKTRFLKSLFTWYEAKKSENIENISVISLFFPEISNSLNINKKENNKEAIFFYDVLFSEERIDFKDFLKVIESDQCDFINDLFQELEIRAPKTRRRAEKAFDKLNEYLYELINRKIYKTEENLYGVATYSDSKEIRNISFTEMFNELSPGELMLFYFSLFLFFIDLRNNNEKIIIIMDEPEQHLYPQKLISIIEKLQKNESIKTLWVATHSIYLLSLFSFESIVYIKQNKIVSKNSDMYKRIFDDLVGLENIDVFEFLKSFESWQCYKFILECFVHPEVVGTGKLHKDEQYQKIKKLLLEKKSKSPDETIKLLDYGAGEFRFYQCFKSEYDIDYRKKMLEYVAFEPYLEKKKDTDFKVYKKIDEIPKKTFDVVILMNVLHEIDICKWEGTFSNIHDVLADEGLLVFLEVLSLTKGEQPFGNTGYLVLKDAQVKILFKDSERISAISVGDKSNAWVIPKKNLTTVNKKLIKSCVISLKEETKEELQKLYNERIDIVKISEKQDNSVKAKARQYAFLSQQYINAEMALQIFEKPFAFEEERKIEKKSIITAIENKSTNQTFPKKVTDSLLSVDKIMNTLENAKTVAETKTADYSLSKMNSKADFERIKYFLHNGTQRQRNYATLYLRRNGHEDIIMEAYRQGKIDSTQANSK